MTKKAVKDIVNESVQIHQQILQDQRLLDNIQEIANKTVMVFRAGGKVLLCGNGGSAADAQHIASELSGKFMMNREPLHAEALHVNTSYLTATANDYSFEEVYSRLVKAKGVKGDVLVALSTSGNSENVVNALKEAKMKELITVGLTGRKKSKVDSYCDYLIKVPSENTARVQEAHILFGHIICELIERDMFA